MPDYTKWPEAGDVLNRLECDATLKAAADPVRVELVINAVIAEVLHRTKRQFIADTEDELRVYDGSDSAVLEIDPMIELTGVTVIGLASEPGYTLSDVQLARAEVGKPRSRLIMAVGGVPAASAVLSPICRVFPAGRQNIHVTGRFGYAAEIPADLWDAVCGEIAIRSAREGLFSAEGRIRELEFSGDKVKFDLPQADQLSWHEQFERAVTAYRTSPAKRIRRLRGPMI